MSKKDIKRRLERLEEKMQKSSAPGAEFVLSDESTDALKEAIGDQEGVSGHIVGPPESDAVGESPKWRCYFVKRDDGGLDISVSVMGLTEDGREFLHRFCEPDRSIEEEWMNDINPFPEYRCSLSEESTKRVQKALTPVLTPIYSRSWYLDLDLEDEPLCVTAAPMPPGYSRKANGEEPMSIDEVEAQFE